MTVRFGVDVGPAELARNHVPTVPRLKRDRRPVRHEAGRLHRVDVERLRRRRGIRYQAAGDAAGKDENGLSTGRDERRECFFRRNF